MNHKLNFYMCLLMALMLITACSVTHPYKVPDANTNGLFRNQQLTDTATLATLHWREIFTDTLLQKLISTGIQQNLDLKTAYARITQAEATYEQSRQAYFPTLGASASVSGNKTTSGSSSNSHPYQLGLNTSWEADIWGQLRSSQRANLANLLQGQAAARAVQTNLVANIANFYYQLLALDQQLVITQQTVESWKATVNVMKALKASNIVTGAAVVQSAASQYAAAVATHDLRLRIRETENALSILLGQAPDTIPRNKLADQHPITLLKTGVPSQLLANRPDVQAAEYNFRYFFELTNVARTYFYPTLTITASGGLAGASLGQLFKPGSLVGNIVAGLAQPIYNQGINRARLKSAQAQQQQALYSFQSILLTAGQEVSDALFSYQTAVDKTGDRDNQLDNLEKSVSYTQQLVRYSSANYTEVLNAQQSLLTAQLGQVNDRLQQLQAIVNLYRALGGGWQ
ncbi:efflux transporter outer membrane subunit [Chitinophaga flava]|uniref:RND transporter n=1 Tax=Chitinophaga flava TaxID=2259036 RepID=A0A365XS46_9BACT|nr:efflux transporter outer membrane subunit [Chitinophaga flava]RBL88960.1 hypothetical protein DF182_20660 [Chitinophaga flava]